MRFSEKQYSTLNAKQKENYNFQKVSAVLADYGYATIRLNDDWEGADFIALHVDGCILKVQLKGRLTIDKKYSGKGIYVCFDYRGTWYLFPHDDFVLWAERNSDVMESKSWSESLGSLRLTLFYGYERSAHAASFC